MVMPFLGNFLQNMPMDDLLAQGPQVPETVANVVPQAVPAETLAQEPLNVGGDVAPVADTSVADAIGQIIVPPPVAPTQPSMGTQMAGGLLKGIGGALQQQQQAKRQQAMQEAQAKATVQGAKASTAGAVANTATKARGASELANIRAARGSAALQNQALDEIVNAFRGSLLGR